ncbi:MAG TPA: metal-sulfur cluster assembly factor [Gemmatimonadaceae bacterium]
MSDTNDTPPAGAPSGTPQPPLSYDDALSADRVRLALRKVKDPELNLNVIDLGLVYEIVVEDPAEGKVRVDMSLTSPGCPSGPEIMRDVENAVRGVSGVKEVVVNLVWTPMWSPERIEPRVRAYMGL